MIQMLIVLPVLNSMKGKKFQNIQPNFLSNFLLKIIIYVYSEQQWRVFTGNELGTLLGWWALECYKIQSPGKDLKNCYMLASTVSSKMLRAMAKVEGFNFIGRYLSEIEFFE